MSNEAPTDIQPLDPTALKRRLREARARLGVSQRKAAALAGISKSVLEKYESRGNDRIPNTRQLFRLARLYHVSLDGLLGLGAAPTEKPAYDLTNGRSPAYSRSF